MSLLLCKMMLTKKIEACLWDNFLCLQDKWKNKPSSLRIPCVVRDALKISYVKK